MNARRGHQPDLGEQAVERLLTGRAGSTEEGLQQAVSLLASMASGPAPEPTPALADLLDRGFEPAAPVVRRPPARRRRRFSSARVGGVLAAGFASILVAGTAQALPPTLQNGIADLVSALTPFEFPRPAAGDGETGDHRAPAPPAGSSSTPGRASASQQATDPAGSSGSDPEPADEQVSELVEPGRAGPSPEDQQRDGQPEPQDPEESADDETQGSAEDAPDRTEDAGESVAPLSGD